MALQSSIAENSVQLSLFDTSENQSKAKDTEKPKKFNPALVPEKDFRKSPYTEIPTVKDILRLLEKATYKIGVHEFLSDVFECSAIAVSNKIDSRNYSRREEKYKNIMKKYDKEMRFLLCDIFSRLYVLLSSQIEVGFNDYLGELYMLSETSNDKSGQFFTPYHLSKACAKLTVDKNQVEECIETDRIITMHEPTSGSGGMVLALADVLYNEYHFNIARNLFVECGDIDTRCVHMCYLQLSLAGIPAIIYHRDCLSLKTWDKWETPAYIMQFPRFRRIVK